MQALQIELVVSLDRHKAHVLARDRFGYRLRIQVVILVRLAIGFDELSGNQPRLVSLLTQNASQTVRPATSLDADQ